MTEAPPRADAPMDATVSPRTAIGVTLGLAVLGYLAFAVWSDFSRTTAALATFRWSLYVPVLALTLVNYTLRYAKWAWLLDHLGVPMPRKANAWAFTAGLGMVVSPGKAGELIKPWLVREVTGVPMARTLPALFTERMTDGVAVVVLSAFGVSTFVPDSTGLILGTLGTLVVGLAVFSIEPLTDALLRLFGRLPVVGRFEHKLTEMVHSLRTCLGPMALAVTLLLSMVAWFAECLGYWLVFQGLGVDCSIELATFLYAFATVFGAAMPGGLGVADAALVSGAVTLIPGLDPSVALVAALLIRFATLWFGVLLGVVPLLRLDALVRDGRAELAGS